MLISFSIYDLVGPLPKLATESRYIVTLVDYFSKWLEAEGLPDKSTKEVSIPGDMQVGILYT